MKPNTNPTDPALDLVRNATEANLLRYAAGRVMFCPACEQCLDWTNTVLVTVYARKGSMPKAEAVKDYLQCGPCFDQRRHHLDKAIADLAAVGIEAHSEIVDGRDPRFKDL